MKYVITYGCGCGDNEMIVEANSLNEAENYAYLSAIEDYESYEGYHGVLTLEEVCEEQGIEDTDSEEAWVAYTEERETTLSYGAEEFDENNEWHQEMLERDGVFKIYKR